MSTRFSQDVVPLTELKVNPGKIVKHTAQTHRPVLLTSRGRGVAVVQDLNSYEEVQEQRDFFNAIVQGLMDVREGRTVTLDGARERLGLAE
ncbi:type II toxin-antitoxin system Phd/YefM family antitoxin [Leucothrix pacifica]|uniref:Antitoxin n=1 Tax=Leucothrix pacifica TaxID=1247513 RepID=A0A317CHQ5_9GAMM|nr:type II toxin-antitoxin system Phd/YefM family antitoxin [Leucothrix pacifica]PWQ97867.1 prevent-host-death family protein [Leucothrix pacifica]